MYGHVCEHVCGHMYVHVYRHVFGLVHIDMCVDVSIRCVVMRVGFGRRQIV